MATPDTDSSVQQLIDSLADMQETLSKYVVEAPQSTLMDCYAPEYTEAVVQNLQNRSVDLQGQVARLNAEKMQTEEDTAVARGAKMEHERQLEDLERELQNLRRSKEIIAQEMESSLGDIAVAQEELTQLKQENQAIIDAGH